jgi:probable FeS assembly SUF system protein SufT
MHTQPEKILTRDCEAILIPSGQTITLKAGSKVHITQSLGGSHTIITDGALARIADENADALGLERAVKPSEPPSSSEPGALDEQSVWSQLKTCYDPEIPVNIVDLGLVYDCKISPRNEGGARVDVKMTLTAPGCGMGPTIAAEARSKIMSLPGVEDAEVELVWDPPWNQGMISEVGKMQLGLI